MKEGITGPIGEFDEAKALFRAEPFRDPTDRWTGRCLDEGSVEPGSGSESTMLRIVGISVEFATPRTRKILICQLGVPREERFDDPGEAEGLTRVDQVGFLARRVRIAGQRKGA